MNSIAVLNTSHMSSCGHLVSSPLSQHLGVELLGPVVNFILDLEGTWFSEEVAAPFYTSRVELSDLRQGMLLHFQGSFNSLSNMLLFPVYKLEIILLFLNLLSEYFIIFDTIMKGIFFIFHGFKASIQKQLVFYFELVCCYHADLLY